MARALALGATAIVLAALDLAHKAAAGADHFHARSPAYAAVVIVLATAWVVAILGTRSLSLALAGGVVAGGALGNLLSLVIWPGVPNPIVLEPIALNLADVFVLAGFLGVAAAALAIVARTPERLREPVRLG